MIAHAASPGNGDALSNAMIALYTLPGAGVNFLYALIPVMYMSFGRSSR